MRKVKIAILDTGLDMQDEELRNFCSLVKKIQLREDLKMNDLNGHGTLVAKTIMDLCRDVEIYPVKIFDDFGKTSSFNVAVILEKLIDFDIDLINLSASTFNYTYEKELRKVCDELKNRNKFLICSKYNKMNHKESIPTIFDSVIGVCGHEDIFLKNEYIYKANQKIQMYANSKEIFVKLGNKITHFGKNSKACAVATGIIANILKDNPDINFNELEEILIQEGQDKEKLVSKKIDTKKRQLYKIKSEGRDNILTDEVDDIERKILNIINKEFSEEVKLDDIKKYGLMNNVTNIGLYNAYDLLNYINKEFNTKIDYKDIFLYELADLKLLKRRIKASLDIT